MSMDPSFKFKKIGQRSNRSMPPSSKVQQNSFKNWSKIEKIGHRSGLRSMKSTEIIGQMSLGVT